MPNPNSFNTPEVKVAIFDSDEEERAIANISDGGMANILKAVSYSLSRVDRYDLGARFTAVLDPDTKISASQAKDIVAHLEGCGATIILTTSDTIIATYGERSFPCQFKFIGACAGFMPARPGSADVNASVDSTGSAFMENEEENLTQRCQMPPSDPFLGY